MEISKILDLAELARNEGGRFPKRRALLDRLAAEEGRHFTGIVGPRGVGKTVLLKQLAREKEGAFYLSLDTLGDADLFETARTLA